MGYWGRMFVALFVLGCAGLSSAAGIKDWSVYAPVGEVRTENDHGYTDTPNGLITSPLWGRGIGLGQTITCQITQATDTDKWTTAYDSGTVTTDVSSYSWDAKDSAQQSAGHFSGDIHSRACSWTAPDAVGTYTINCTIDDDIPDTPPGQTGVSKPETGTRNDPAVVRSHTVFVIGGPISGDHVARYFCGATAPAGPLLSAAPNQPAGTSYSWAVTTGVDKLALNAPTDTNQVTCRGIGGSEADNDFMYDVVVTLTYSLGGGTYTTTHQLTVVQPWSITLTDSNDPTEVDYPNDPPGNTNWYGFDGQTRTYTIYDQFHRPMPGVGMNEVWDNPSQGWIGPHAINWPAGANMDGTLVDSFEWDNYQPQGLNLTRPQEVLMGTKRQRLWAGSSASGQGCGPYQTFNSVEYHTDGARNFN